MADCLKCGGNEEKGGGNKEEASDANADNTTTTANKAETKANLIDKEVEEMFEKFSTLDGSDYTPVDTPSGPPASTIDFQEFVQMMIARYVNVHACARVLECITATVRLPPLERTHVSSDLQLAKSTLAVVRVWPSKDGGGVSKG